jgi:hypothetical protein
MGAPPEIDWQGGAVAGNEALDGWWQGLSGQQKAEAIRCADAGQLSDDIRQSLQRSGVTEPGEGEVIQYLKMRH